MPIAFITAKDGKNVQSVLDLAQNLHKQAGRASAPAISTASSGKRCSTSSRPSAEPPAQGLSTRPRSRRIRRPSCCSPTGRSCSTRPTSAICSRRCAITCRFADVPIKLYLRDKNREDRVPGATAGGFVRADRDTAAQEGETNRGQTAGPQAEGGRTGLVGRVSHEEGICHASAPPRPPRRLRPGT